MLEVLNLSHNELAKFPSLVLLLPNLKELKIQHNHLRQLPLELFEMSSLESLDVSNNQITVLPEKLDSIQKISLKKLTISNNCLQTLPTNWKNFHKLHHLNLKNNRLQYLPYDLGNLPQLVTLEINGNQLVTFPDYLNKLKINLGLFDNPFFKLPKSLLKKGQNILRRTSNQISNSELTRIFCLAYFSPQEAIKKQAVAPLRKFLDIDQLKKYSIKKNPNFQTLITFFLKASNINPKLDWQVIDEWIEYLHIRKNIEPKVDMPQLMKALGVWQQQSEHLEWDMLEGWIEKYSLISTVKLDYHQLIALYLDISSLDTTIEWVKLHQWMKNTEAVIDKPVSLNDYYHTIYDKAPQLHPPQWEAFARWNWYIDIKFHQAFNLWNFFDTLHLVFKESPIWNWAGFGYFIKNNNFKADSNLNTHGVLGWLSFFMHTFPLVNLTPLYQFMQNTHALSNRKVGVKNFFKTITEITQSLSTQQWHTIDFLIKQMPIRLMGKISLVELSQLLIKVTKNNPQLNWTLVTNWMKHAKGLTNLKIENHELLIQLVHVKHSNPSIDLQMLDDWIDTLEVTYEQSTDFQELFQVLLDFNLLEKADWELLDNWMEKLQIKSNQRVKITNLYLETIPEEIFNYWHNTSVNFSGNLLQYIPFVPGKMNHIRYLDLSQNLINTFYLEKDIIFKSLRQLKLTFNLLDQFPVAFMQSKDLESVDLSHNKLTEKLPQNGNFPKLKTLNLSFNLLKEFPIVNPEVFPKLETLDLSFNHLTKLPDYIAEFEQLKVLDLSYNRLGKFDQQFISGLEYALPLNISFLEKLTHLYLQHNGLKTLPPGIGLIDSLHTLDFSNNQFTEFPIELCEAENLEVLNISHNKISYLPNDLKDIPQLKQLNLSGNPLSAYEVRKVQNLLPDVEILFDAFVPPLFTPLVGKKIKRAAKEAHSNGLIYSQEEYDQYASGYFKKAAIFGHNESMFELAQIEEGYAHNLDIYWYLTAAINGHAISQRKIGESLLHDQITNFDKTVYWYTLAAQQEDLEAQLALAQIYREGKGMNKNIKYAIYWLEQAAQQDNIEAITALAKIYEQGLSVNRNYAKAFVWYEKLASQEIEIAQYKLAEYYRQGLGVERDIGKAAALYIALEEKWTTLSTYNADIKRTTLPIHYYTLGQAYELGLGVVQDDVQAEYFYEKSAKQGDKYGELKLGQITLEQSGFLLAKPWLESAAEKGLIEAQNTLGNLYLKGEKTLKNELKAIKWFKMATDRGDAEAQHMMGEIFFKGNLDYNIPQEYSVARKWFEKAAAQDYELAKKRLGDIYANGWGVEKDDATAGYWYSQVDSDLLAL